MTEAEPIRVFVLNKHEVERTGLAHYLAEQEGIVVVGEAEDPKAALPSILETRPHVVVLDLHFPRMSGVEACRAIKARHPEISCLLLTAFAEEKALVDAIVAGASGYMLKVASLATIAGGVRTVAAGHVIVDPRIAGMLLRTTRSDDRLDRLTEQERRVFALLAEGFSNKEIADRLFLADQTVRNYVHRVLSKLGLKNRVQLAVLAARRSRDWQEGGSPTDVARAL